MELATSQHKLLHCLKTRGPQSVKILSNQLDMTTMGVRQHLSDLEGRSLVRKREETRQNRGRPVHLWELTGPGHRVFPDHHQRFSVELIAVLQDELGAGGLQPIIDRQQGLQAERYLERLQQAGEDLQSRLQLLAELRREEGYMAEVRLMPDGWLLIQNHCPVAAAAGQCPMICEAELEMFRQLLEPARVERSDYLLAGDRRCAYKIKASES